MQTSQRKKEMNKHLLITESIPNKAAILLVDVQNHYFDEVLDELDSPEKEKRTASVEQRLHRMRKKLETLKEEGHPIYAIANESSLHPILSGVPHFFLPEWEMKTMSGGGVSLHPDISEGMKNANAPVLVCGLWLEMCVKEVARLLNEKGVLAYISLDSDLTFENALIWEEGDEDVISLEGECEAENIELLHC